MTAIPTGLPVAPEVTEIDQDPSPDAGRPDAVVLTAVPVSGRDNAPVTSRAVVLPRVLLGLYVAVVAFIVFQPVPDIASGTVGDLADLLYRLGLDPTVVTGARVEFALNALMFAPIPFLGTWVFPRFRWTDWVVIAFLGSIGVELIQALFLDARSAQYVDIVSNTLGGLIGALAARWTTQILTRDRKK